VYRFGSRDCDPQTALEEYLRVKDDLLAGRTPRPGTGGLTVRYACNHFLTDRHRRLEAGDLTVSSFNDYKKTCERLIREFGATRAVDDLRPEDFAALRSSLARKWAPTTLGNEVQRIRVVFNYSWQAELIEKPIRFGPSFHRPSKRTLRQHRQSKDRKLFSPNEIRDMLTAASAELKAMILLGINAGLGNRDCAKLEFKHLDLVGSWLDYPRPKTGIERRAKLWPETIAAIEAALATRKEPKLEEHRALIFVTKYRGPWYSEANNDCPIAKESRKLLDSLGINRKGVGFYALRHTFKTIGDETRDFAAVEHIMGHESPGLQAVYREAIGDDRLESVANHLRTWVWGAVR
jgi:integrase